MTTDKIITSGHCKNIVLPIKVRTSDEQVKKMNKFKRLISLSDF